MNLSTSDDKVIDGLIYPKVSSQYICETHIRVVNSMCRVLLRLYLGIR